ncbi:MAG: helix-turn-helix domain-containing protein [Bacillota bacterium]
MKCECIRRLREEKGLSQSDLAHLTGADQSLICKLEKGHTSGSVNSIYKIDKALSVSVHDLFGNMV